MSLQQSANRPARAPVPRCPVRPGEPCTLCNPAATGPGDCPTVYLVMTEPELRQKLTELRRQARRSP